MTKVNFLKNVVAIVASLAATTVFASCEPADEPATDAPAFVEFSFANQRGTSDIDAKKRTVKAVAECGTNIASIAPAFKLSPEGTTATVDGKAQESGKTANNFADAVVYKLTTPDGETAEWMVTITLPDDCPTVKKYITYNKPVKEYFVEYKQSNLSYTYAEACESRKYAYAYSGNGEFAIDYISGGQWLIYVYPSKSGGYVWGIYGTEDTYFGSAINTRYEDMWYPLAHFAGWVSTISPEDTWFVRRNYYFVVANGWTLPNHTDVTSLYKRSEKLCGIINNIESDGDDCLTCDVYEDHYNLYTHTFWVEPTTGFTLKYQTKKDGGETEQQIAVSKILVGKPDWDGLHLYPLSTDEVKDSW